MLNNTEKYSIKHSGPLYLEALALVVAFTETVHSPPTRSTVFAVLRAVYNSAPFMLTYLLEHGRRSQSW